jgi:hypothetical protein
MVFTSLEYNITLDTPAAEDNVRTPPVQIACKPNAEHCLLMQRAMPCTPQAILGVLIATLNSSGSVACYARLFKGEVESCSEYVLAE